MRNILVTGAAGFIGSHLVEALLADPENAVVGLDNCSTGSEANVARCSANPRFRLLRCDVNEWEQVAPHFSAGSFDYVFHYAAMVGVARTLAHPLAVLRDIEGHKNIAGLAAQHGVRRVFLASSSEVYGEPVEYPQHEDSTPLNSRLPYAVVKNVGENYFRAYQQEAGLPVTIFRFFNTYGPRQNDSFVVARFIRRALAGEPLIVYGDGSQFRTFLYIADNIAATLACLYRDLHINDTLNVGSDRRTTIGELAEEVAALLPRRPQIVRAPPLAEGDMRGRCPDTSKIRRLLGGAFTPLRVGLANCLAWEQERAAAPESEQV